ncbi:MAG: RagB/SusD family nutrient uptake outer membrane protein [Bacteroidota bacterium]
MRKKIKILAIAATIFVAFACDEDKFLDQQNPNAITPEIFWKTADDFQAALVTVYGATQFHSISGSGLTFEMLLADMNATNWWHGHFAYNNHTYSNNDNEVTQKWADLYVGVFRANQILDKLETESVPDLSSDERAQIEGQVRFLRAFFFFTLAHTYGGAVIHTTVPSGSNEFTKPFSSIEEVTNTVILPDLEIAVESLPEVWTANQDIGRATWGAAKTLQGKTFLFVQDYAAARDAFKEVIDAGVYSLVPNILDNFTTEDEFNSESIFEVSYSETLVPGEGGGLVDSNPGNISVAAAIGAEATTIVSAMATQAKGGFHVVQPTYYAHELFIFDEPDLNLNMNIQAIDVEEEDTTFFTQSRRMHASIVDQNSDGLYYLLPAADADAYNGGQSAYTKKWSNWYDRAGEVSPYKSGINFRHIRYADVLLMYAEAILEADGDVSTAIDYIDRVRARAGVVTLQAYLAANNNTFPEFHKPILASIGATRSFTAPTVEAVRTHLRMVERPLELYAEGHRFKDLVRWGIAEDIFNQRFSEEEDRANNPAIIAEHEARLDINVPREDFVIKSVNYASNPAQFSYYPIPSQEVQTNPALGN